MAINFKPEKKTAPMSILPIKESDRPFSRVNYWLMGGCLVLIVLGFLLMSGGGSTVENGFNPDIFSTRRIVVGPLLAFLGFMLMALAIIYNPGKKPLFGNRTIPGEFPEDKSQDAVSNEEQSFSEETTLTEENNGMA